MLHFKHRTERVCVDVPLLTRRGEHLSAITKQELHRLHMVMAVNEASTQ